MDGRIVLAFASKGGTTGPDAKRAALKESTNLREVGNFGGCRIYSMRDNPVAIALSVRCPTAAAIVGAVGVPQGGGVVISGRL